VKPIFHYFRLQQHQTTWPKEVRAGFTSFFAASYILIVNSLIITDSGIPFEAATMATALTSFLGCLIMGLWANAPLILVPGMGVNAFFTYTIVHEMGLKWTEALAVVLASGILFAIAAFTPLSQWIARSVPYSLKQGMTVGIGLLITFIGLQKGGLIAANEQTFVAIELNQPKSWLTLFSFAATIVLFTRQVRGTFLISMGLTTLAAWLMGFEPHTGKAVSLSLAPTLDLIQSITFAGWKNPVFWSATLILTMVLVFENMGMVQGLLPDPSKFSRSYQACALSATSSGILGTSPTICALESATGIADGGKTGLTSLTAGVLFFLSIPLIPLIRWIPDSAIASILIVVGGLMIREVETIPFKDVTEGIPAFVTFAFIPFTYSIPDGIALGFLTYAILKLVTRKQKELSFSFYVLALLFIVQLTLHL